MNMGQNLRQFCYSLLPTLTLISSVLYFSSSNGYVDKNGSYNQRYPANANLTCHQLIKGLIGSNSIPGKAWKELSDVSSKYRFDFRKYTDLKKRYLLELESTPLKELDFKHSPESILALAESVNKNAHSELEPKIAKLSFIKRRKLERLVTNFEKVDKPELEHIEEFVANIYSTVLGPQFKLSHLMNSTAAKNKIMARIVQEDILKYGLVEMLGRSSELKSTQGFLKRFMDSYKGKYLATMIFNLPVLVGFPPLYLPGLKKLKIPPAIAREIIEKGLTDEMMQKLNVEVLQELSIKLEYRTGYEVLRRYYMAGISIYLSYVIIDEFYEGEKIREENQLLEEVAIEMADIFDQAETLQSRGIDIFSESDIDNASGNGDRTEFNSLDNPYCRAVKECLKMHREDTGEEAIKGSRPYEECKVFMDPLNKCIQY